MKWLNPQPLEEFAISLRDSLSQEDRICHRNSRYGSSQEVLLSEGI